MTVHVKLLNGDLLQVEYNDNKHVFVRQLYDAFPEIPYGCLVLKRLGEEEELVEIVDNDELCALVDTSLVRPVVKIRGKSVEDIIHDDHDEDDEERIVEFCVQFLSTKDDGYCSDVEIFYNTSTNRYALKDQTIWFSSPIDCLKSVENARFPQDQETLETVPRQFNLYLDEYWVFYDTYHADDDLD